MTNFSFLAITSYETLHKRHTAYHAEGRIEVAGEFIHIHLMKLHHSCTLTMSKDITRVVSV